VDGNTLSELENVFGKSAKDCGLTLLKPGGLFCKNHGRRGIFQFRPSDFIWTAKTRSGWGKGAGRPELGGITAAPWPELVSAGQSGDLEH